MQCLGTAQWNGTPPACYPLQKPSAALTEEFDKSKAEANELAKELGLEVAKERGMCTILFFSFCVSSILDCNYRQKLKI